MYHKSRGNGTAFLIVFGFILQLTVASSNIKDYGCFRHEFQCRDEHDVYCIDRGLVCNGFQDCRDNSDETDCQARDCSSGQFRCLTNFGLSCFPNFYKCDGERDCNDGYDEVDCHRIETMSAKSSGFYLFDYLKNRRRIKEAQNSFYR